MQLLLLCRPVLFVANSRTAFAVRSAVTCQLRLVSLMTNTQTNVCGWQGGWFLCLFTAIVAQLSACTRVLSSVTPYVPNKHCATVTYLLKALPVCALSCFSTPSWICSFLTEITAQTTLSCSLPFCGFAATAGCGCSQTQRDVVGAPTCLVLWLAAEEACCDQPCCLIWAVTRGLVLLFESACLC